LATSLFLCEITIFFIGKIICLFPSKCLVPKQLIFFGSSFSSFSLLVPLAINFFLKQHQCRLNEKN
jgi:hypothetical protein